MNTLRYSLTILLIPLTIFSSCEREIVTVGNDGTLPRLSLGMAPDDVKKILGDPIVESRISEKRKEADYLFNGNILAAHSIAGYKLVFIDDKLTKIEAILKE
jgi:hypothetical protein